MADYRVYNYNTLLRYRSGSLPRSKTVLLMSRVTKWPVEIRMFGKYATFLEWDMYAQLCVLAGMALSQGFVEKEKLPRPIFSYSGVRLDAPEEEAYSRAPRCPTCGHVDTSGMDSSSR